MSQAFDRVRGMSGLSENIERVAIYTGDTPPVDVQCPCEGHRVFCISDLRERADMCVPCFSFMHWKEAGIQDYEETLVSIKERNQVPVEVDKMFWIGNLQTHPNRRVLHDTIAASRRDLMDCMSMEWTGEGRGTRYVSLPEHCKWSILFDIEGCGFSARMKFLAHMARPLIIQERPYWDFATAGLKAGVHYVSVKRDLSDLVEKVQDVKNNTAKYAGMVEACNAYAREHMTRDNAIEQIVKVVFKATGA
jgi:hypothetical protein